jgi:phosphatidylglycerophosphate synthase
MKRVPAALVAFRLCCAPALVMLERLGAPGRVLAVVVFFAFVSDVFDGIIARRLGVATANLRRADSIVDALFYLAALAVLFLRAPSAARAGGPGIAVLVLLEVTRLLVERHKFGKMASYHMWSAKAWGVALWLGFSEAFITGHAGPFFWAAITVGIVADVEGLASSFILSSWHHDVRSIWHAIRLQRGNRPAA